MRAAVPISQTRFANRQRYSGFRSIWLTFQQVMLYRNLMGLENLEYFTALAGHEHPRGMVRPIRSARAVSDSEA